MQVGQTKQNPKPKKINLRTPDVMEAVQAEVLTHYRSELVDHIRANGNQVTVDGLTIRLAKEFGFCYGVERAIDLAYAARKVFKDKPLYLIGEIIHNPEVNHQIKAMGIQVICGKESDVDADIERLQEGDIVIIPAFGAEVSVMDRIKAKGCQFVDTTCGDVMSVWKRVRQYARDQYTSIIHGKAWHEETKATSSRATSQGNGHYLVVFDLDETAVVCDYIRNGGDREAFLEKFKGAYSKGFDPDEHLKLVGVANQTTMLRGETEEVQNRLKKAMVDRYGEDELAKHFRSFDTICGATQDRQDALRVLLKDKMDLLLVVGGYNSSNTSHLAEMGEASLPTFFIKNASKLKSAGIIQHYNQHTKDEIETSDWWPEGDLTVGITAGASCPNNLIEDVIRRVVELKSIPIEKFYQKLGIEEVETVKTA